MTNAILFIILGLKLMVLWRNQRTYHQQVPQVEARQQLPGNKEQRVVDRPTQR